MGCHHRLEKLCWFVAVLGEEEGLNKLKGRSSVSCVLMEEELVTSRVVVVSDCSA